MNIKIPNNGFTLETDQFTDLPKQIYDKYNRIHGIPVMQNDMPTYDEYKAEIEKRFPGIDEKYIQERYKGYYSESNVESPDVKSEATDIRVEVTNKVPAELEKTVKAVKLRSGIDIVFGNRYVDGKLDTKFRGLFDGKKIIVSENATKADIFNAVVLHELTHGIEGTKKYKGIYDYVLKEMYGDDAARLDADVEAKIAEYKKNGIELTPEKAKGEIVAENVGKYIFADDVGSIVTKNYTLGQKILDVINELIYNIKKKFGNTFELDELAAAQRKYRMALDEVKRNGVKTADDKYSIETIPGTNKKYVKFGRDLELGKTKEEWSANIEKYIKDNITKNGSITIVTEDGDPIVINGRTAWKIADVQKTKDGVKVPMSDSELRVKYEAGAHIDELVEISKRGNKTEPDDGSHDWANEWNYRTAFFEDSKGDKYRMRISVGINPKEAAAYNVGSIQKRGDLRDGPSSAIADGGALNGDAPRGTVYHDKSQLSSENKTEMQLAYEKALAKSGNNEQYSFASQNDIDSAVADFEAHYGEMYRGLIDRYKTIKPGEIPQVEDVKVPKKTGKREYVSNYARTMAETRVFSEAMQGEFEKMVVDGNFSHERVSNKKAERSATSRIEQLGFENAVNEFETLVHAGRLNKDDIAMGQILLNVACQNKDVAVAKKLAVDLSMAATQFGQNVQAFSMIKRMSPDGQLYYLERTVQKINNDIRKKYSGKFSEVEIDSKLAEDLLNAKNQEEINEAVYALEKSIGEQMPASFEDKWNAWRYLAMYDASKRGASAEEAFNYGTVIGGITYLTSKIGVEKLFSMAKMPKSSWASSILKVTQQGGIEGTEELVEQVLSNIADDVIMGEKSNYNILVNEYIAQGYSKEEARNKAFAETYIYSAIEAFGAGALGGVISGSGANIIGGVNGKIKDNNKKLSPLVNLPTTEGGVVTSGARSIDNIVNGTATNKDYDLFEVGQNANRQAFEEATGVKLPATNSETRKFLRDFAENQGIKKSTLSKKNVEGAENLNDKADVGSQVPYNSNATPQLQTSETPLVSSSANNNIPQTGNAVNNQYMQNDMPTYDEYKAEIEKRFPGIDEKYIQERYKGYYSESNVESPDVKSEAKDIRVEVTGKIPAELEKTVKAVKLRSGIDIVFGNRYVDGKVDTNFRGMFDGKKIIVSENATKAEVFEAIVMHELTHGIEGTKYYKDIADFCINLKYISEEHIEKAIENKIAAYKKSGKTLTPEEARAELVAESIREAVFSDDVKSIVGKNYTLGQKIYDYITEILYKLNSKFGNLYNFNELKTVQRKYRMALDEIKRKGLANKNTSFSFENKVYDYTKSFGEQIEDWISGKVPQYDTLLIGKTPDVFKKIGLNSLPFTINQEHVDYAVNGTKDADHYIGKDMLKQLPQALENPIAIFQDTRNTQIDNRLIALLKLTHNGKQVIVPVAIDGFGTLNGKSIDSNAVISVFAKGNSVEKMLNDALLSESYGNKSMFYWNKKEAFSLLQTQGHQLPNHLPQDGFIHSIRENDAFVNYRLENVTHSQQFKRWFGDWLKNPQKASKIVNEDGTPMVVYHGTRSEFAKFNKWSYFTEDKNYADLYASERHGRPKGEVMAVYINSRKPFDIRNKEIMDIYEKEFIPTQKLPDDLLVTDIGLPHAVVADDLIRFIEEKGYDYDSIVLDEAGMDDGSGYKRISYVVKEPTQIKSATDNIGTFDKNNPNVKYSFTSQKDIDSAVADFEAHYGEMYRGLIDKYGTIKPGEIPQVEDVQVPNQTGEREYVSNYARTMAETKVVSEALKGDFEKMVVDGNFSRERVSNKSAERSATAKIEQLGFEDAVKEFEFSVKTGKLNKNDIAMGQILLNVACQDKDVELAKKLAVDLTVAATQFGQNVQAFSMIKRMSPDGQLYYLERTVQKINNDIRKKYSGKFSEVEIDSKLAEDLLNAKNQEEINEAVYALEKSIGEQMPASREDKWNAWRYLAMLGNTRTHFRNVFGNMAFVPAKKMKDVIGASIEKAVLPKEQRTKSLTKTKESKAFAKQDFEKMSDIIKGNEGKYGTQRGIEEHRKIFETKWLEAARKFNQKALEFEDGIFLKLAYEDAFAQAMTARGLTPEYLNSGTKVANTALQGIREYAINEAQKATYRDSNAFSDFISGIKYRGDSKGIKVLDAMTVEGVLPLKKTPANILVRVVEYSPVGLMKTIFSDTFKLRNGDISASKYIDSISSGLTGTGIVALGAFLSHLGILVVSPDEDDDIAGYKKMFGAQSYAIKLGDNTYTIDWMTPSSLPLFVGAETHNAAKSTEGFTFKNITDALSRISEPMFELSCLSGMQSALEAVRYADDDNIVSDLIFDMASSYVSQALPSLGGQLARTIDNTQRNAYYKDRNGIMPQIIDSFINKAAAKIPFVSRMLPEKVDRWGRTQKYGSLPERTLENFVSPGYYSKEAPTWTDNKIMSIYKNTGDKGVIPKTAPKSFEVNGKRKYLTDDEYVEYSKTRGQLSYKYVTEFLKIPANIDDETRVEIIRDIYEYANAKAKEKVSDYELPAKYRKADKAKSPAVYYYNYHRKKQK